MGLTVSLLASSTSCPGEPYGGFGLCLPAPLAVVSISNSVCHAHNFQAAVHLGQDYQDTLRTTKNTDFEKVETLFHVSQTLIGYLRLNGVLLHG